MWPKKADVALSRLQILVKSVTDSRKRYYGGSLFNIVSTTFTSMVLYWGQKAQRQISPKLDK